MPRPPPLRILLLILHPGFLRFFDTVVPRLLEDGHEVHLAFSFTTKKVGGMEALPATQERLYVDTKDFPVRSDPWRYFADPLRLVDDYVRYLDAKYAGTSFLRQRSGDKLPRIAEFLLKMPHLPGPLVLFARWLLSGFEHLIPSDPTVDAYLDRVKPDMILVCPLVEKKSGQTELVKSGRAAGIPVGLCVGSWDHLSTKGAIHVQPDKVFVWNEIQKREAMEFHGVRPQDTVVTGAHPFDMWFRRTPTLSREAFLKKHDLPADKPFVVFAGSSPQICDAEEELEFVQAWVQSLRRNLGPAHRDIGLLIRPHPLNFKHWVQAAASTPEGVAIYPRHGANPVSDDDRAEYYDAMFHSAAVVGINTSAMVEAPILNRPVMTILADQFKQRETLHFRYLLPENGGCLLVANDFEDHARQIEALLDAPDSRSAAVGRFVDTFLRPRGRRDEALDHLIAGIEQFAVTHRRRRRGVPILARPFSWALGKMLDRTMAKQMVEDAAHEAARGLKLARHQAKLERKAEQERLGRPDEPALPRKVKGSKLKERATEMVAHPDERAEDRTPA